MKKMLLTVMSMMVSLFKQEQHNRPLVVAGNRSGDVSKSKKGAQHAQNLIGKSAVGLYSRAHGVHWRKA